MTALIAMIALLLCIILLIAVFQLFKQIQFIKSEKQDDIHNIMQFYLNEIKEENKKLEQNINLNKDSHKTKDNKTLTEESELKNNAGLISEEDSLLNLIKQEDVYEPSLAVQIFELESKGLSTEQISKKLKCGVTEVELILKLRR